MRPLLACLLLLSRFALGQTMPQDPISTQHGTLVAHFSEIINPTNKDSGTKLVINNREGKTVFSGEIIDEAVEGARWTEDGKYLVMTATNGGGHSPWHHPVFIFSVDHGQIRRLDDSPKPIVSTEIWCQPPDMVILVAHDFRHGIVAPDDPVLVRYRLKDLWPKLK